MPVLTLFFRLFVRPLRREALRTAIATLAIALGVGVLLSIELAGEAAAGSFRASMETLAGNSDFEVTATGGIPPEVLTRLALLPEPLTLHPRIEDNAVIESTGATVPLIGVDLVGDVATRHGDDGVWVGPDLRLAVGSTLRLVIGDRPYALKVHKVLDSGGDVVVMDLAPLSRLLGRSDGRLDRILVDVPKSRADEDWKSRLRAALPPGVTVAGYGARTEENRRMLQAFRWNLRVLSYIALVVGAFLIYNTISVSVVRRRSEIGVLRALGATRGRVLAAFLLEAALLGLAGATLGLGIGRLMAEGSVRLVATTVNSLYVSSRPGDMALTWETALLGLILGIGVSLLSSLAPAWEASRVAPVEAMARMRAEHQARVHKLRDLGFAAVFAIAGVLCARQPAFHGRPLFGYFAALSFIAASAFAIPSLVALLAGWSGRALFRVLGVEALLASRSLAGSLRRTSVLVGALSTAVAMMAAVAIMVGSFRETVIVWMGDRLQADLYLRPAGPSGGDRFPTMAPDTVDRLQRLPEVAAVDPFRAYLIHYQNAPATLGAGDSLLAASRTRRSYLGGEDPLEVARELRSGDNAIVSEPFANKHGVRKGDTIMLSLGDRRVSFRILAVYPDYASERGYVILDRATLLRYLADPAPSSVAVYLHDGVAPQAGQHAVESALAGRKVRVFTNRSLREEAIRIFDRTFAVTYALEAVAVFVAMMGVAGALMALVIDRRREFGLLRFLGGARMQVRRLIFFEAGLLGLLANFAGAGLGYVLSLLLIRVINRQSFGWTIQFHWPVAVLLGAFSLVYVATLAAAWNPARVATRLNPIEVVHEE